MSPKNKIQSLLQDCCDEVFAFIQHHSSEYEGGLVPATEVNEKLGINYCATPKGSKDPSGQRGWLLATFARMLEDQGRIETIKDGSRTVYKITTPPHGRIR